MTNPDTVERLRELLGKASAGPWYLEHAATVDGLTRIDDGLQHGMYAIECEAHDAALIVEAINALPALLAVVEALEEVRSMAHSHVSSYNRNGPEWTSDQGTELYSASFVVESHAEIADVAQAALATLKGEG